MSALGDEMMQPEQTVFPPFLVHLSQVFLSHCVVEASQVDSRAIFVHGQLSSGGTLLGGGYGLFYSTISVTALT